MSTKKSNPPPPFFPLKHDFARSLDHYVEEANALAEVVRTCLGNNMIDAKVRDIVAERLDAFDIARYGGTK